MILGLVECGTHAIIGAVTGPYSTSENEMYFGLHRKLDPSMLLMADRGYFSYRSFKDSTATGAQLLWRVRGNMVLPALVRVVEYTVSHGVEASEPRLLTMLLDPGVASAQELTETYAKWWEIELCFTEIKTHQ